MAAHIGKCILLIACAAAMFVDMQCKDIGRTGIRTGWQAVQLRFYEDALAHLIEPDKAV